MGEETLSEDRPKIQDPCFEEEKGQNLEWDVTCVDTFANCYLRTSCGQV